MALEDDERRAYEYDERMARDVPARPGRRGSGCGP
jgi:hypothetical protein